MRKIELQRSVPGKSIKEKEHAVVPSRGYSVLCFIVAAALFLGGCSADTLSSDVENDDNIVLLDPMEELETFEAAAYRNLYSARVVTGNIFPDIVEYSFQAGNVTFDHYEVMVGDTVKKGQVLACADTEALDKRIEALEEQLQDMEEQQQKYIKDTEEDLYEPEQEAKRLKDIVEAYEKAEPEKYTVIHRNGNASGGDAFGEGDAAISGEYAEDETIISEEYTKWETEYNRFNGQYRILSHQNNTVRLQMEQRTQLYELEHAYLLSQLERLREERKQYTITSSVNGIVVAMKMGDAVSVDAEDRYATVAPRSFIKASVSVPRNNAVIAVGDGNHKLVKCEYIRASVIEGAQEVYAFIDGRRYEVNYVNTGIDSYSIFEFMEDVELLSGTNAYIVLVYQSREQVLTVPESAVSGERGGYYVFSRQESGSVMTPVTIGMSDGVYVEILSGLSEGDEVVVSSTLSAGKNRTILEVGSPANTVDYKGVLFYPSIYWVTNPVEHGTAYFVESKVEQYQQVKAGDVVASIRVQKDDILLKEYETKLKRLNERLADLISQGEDKNKKAIEQQREAIAEIEEEMAEWNEDYAVTKIVADRAGIILDPPHYSTGDILKTNAVIAEVAEVKGDEFYLVIPEAGSAVKYGEEGIIVSYLGSDIAMHETTAKTLSLPAGYLSESLASGYALAALPYESAADMLALYASVSGTGYREEVIVKVPIQPIDNVVLVPSSAVKVIAGQTYVFVVEENGDIVARSFISAGNGYGYYWVIDGLTEGMEICL